MSTKKRKAEVLDGNARTKQKVDKIEELEHEETNKGDTNLSDCGSSNSVSQQKSDNGGSTVEAGTSENSNASKENVEIVEIEDEEPDGRPAKGKEGAPDAGTLLFGGGTNWDLIGRKELPKNAKGAVGPNLWGPHRLSALKGVRVKFVASGCTSCHSILITDGGKLMSWGRNDKGQLGLLDTNRRDNPCVVESLKEHNFVSAACGRSHSLFLTDNSVVYACGDNKMGQCGVGSQNPLINTPTKVTFKGKPVTSVACGAEFSVILDVRGGLYSFGLPEYGQLGHNTDGRYFVTSNKLSFRCELVPRRVIAYIEKTREGHVTLLDDVQIVEIACGLNHAVAVDSKRRCYSWGFGGYGRLGHAEPKDEFVPRLIKSFDGPNRRVKHVYAGGSFSMAVNEFDVLFFWGQNKRAGEATMYPKPVQDLTGWKVRDAACSSTSIIVIAEESVIAWGPSPTYGELCYGEKRLKSSTTPQEVKTLDGLHIKQVACGVGHSLFIARDETDDDKAKLDELPEFTP